MRRKYRRQSYISPVLWSVALVAVTGYSGWRFGWFPSASFRFSESGTAQINPEPPPAATSNPFNSDQSETPDTLAENSQAPSPFEPPEEQATPITSVAETNNTANPFSSPQPPGNAYQTGGPVIQTISNNVPRETNEAQPAATPTRIATAINEKPVTDQFPVQPVPEPPQFDFSEIDRLLAQDEYLTAHKKLSQLYWKRPELREAMLQRINTTARSIFFSKQPHYLTPYEVQSGDQLQNIASLYQVSWEYLANLNQVDPRKIRVNQKLKVLKGPFSAVVDLSDFELTIHSHGYFVKRYQVGIGKAGSSPIGKFTVLDKLKDPTYYGPDGLVMANDDPANPLGEYWIDIGDSFGIHGTIDPESIGKAESKGCIRMHADDIAEVYNFLIPNSQVVIRR